MALVSTQWLEEFLALPNRIPSDDTFRRVFEFIDPEALHLGFVRWVETLVTQTGGEIVPIDGKTLRSSYGRNQGKSALHVISAWASEQRLVLAQLKLEDKSNEITAISALLELLSLAGCIVTIDAIGTKTEIAQKIIHKQADYVLALKANHPTLPELNFLRRNLLRKTLNFSRNTTVLGIRFRVTASGDFG